MLNRRRSLCDRLIPAWLERCCRVDRSLYECAGSLYDSWRHFAHARHEEPGSPAEFAAEMERRGYTCDRIPPIERNRIRWGLRLR